MNNSTIKDKPHDLSALQAEHTHPGKVFIPKADICECKDSIVVKAEIPGADENSVDITLDRNILTITAAVPAPKHEGYSLNYSEYRTGDYRRAFTLPSEIDRNGIEADVKNGVLRLILPKSKESLPKKITVTAG